MPLSETNTAIKSSQDKECNGKVVIYCITRKGIQNGALKTKRKQVSAGVKL